MSNVKKSIRSNVKCQKSIRSNVKCQKSIRSNVKCQKSIRSNVKCKKSIRSNVKCQKSIRIILTERTSGVPPVIFFLEFISCVVDNYSLILISILSPCMHRKILCPKDISVIFLIGWFPREILLRGVQWSEGSDNKEYWESVATKGFPCNKLSKSWRKTNENFPLW